MKKRSEKRAFFQTLRAENKKSGVLNIRTFCKERERSKRLLRLFRRIVVIGRGNHNSVDNPIHESVQQCQNDDSGGKGHHARVFFKKQSVHNQQYRSGKT